MKIKQLAILLFPIALFLGCSENSGIAPQNGTSDSGNSSILALSSNLTTSSSGNIEESVSSSSNGEIPFSAVKPRSSSSTQQSSSSLTEGFSKRCYVKDDEEGGTYCIGYADLTESECSDNGGQLVNSCPTTGVVDECGLPDPETGFSFIAYDALSMEFCTFFEDTQSSSSSETSSNSAAQEQAYGCYINDPDSGPYCVQTNMYSQSSCIDGMDGTVKTSCPTSGTVQSCDLSEGEAIYKVYTYSEDGSNLCSLSLAKRAKMRLLP